MESSSNPEKISPSAKTVILSVMGMLRTVRDIEEEFSRGLRTLNETVEELESSIIPNAFSDLSIQESAPIDDPQEILNCVRKFSTATSKTLGVGRNPRNETLLTCAEETKHWVNTVVQVVRGTAKACDDDHLKNKITTSGKQTCEAYLELCKKVINIAACEDKTQVPIMKQNLNEYSQKVANGVKELVILAEELKGDDFIDPNDPNNIAEIELRAAAAKIEAAAAKLAMLQPKPKNDKLFDASDLTFDEIILDAAKSIAGATTKS